MRPVTVCSCMVVFLLRALRKRNIGLSFYLSMDISICHLDSSFGLSANTHWPIQAQGFEMFLAYALT